MNEKWKRGAVVGIASAAILTAGGGAAMAAGGSHGTAKPVAAVRACPLFKVTSGKAGVVIAKPALPTPGTSSTTASASGSVSASAGTVTVPSASTRTLPKGAVRVTGACPAPKGSLCKTTLTKGPAGVALRLAKTIRVAKPVKGVVVQVVPKGALRTQPGGCATAVFAPCATGLKSVAGTAAPHNARVFVLSCGPVVKAKR